MCVLSPGHLAGCENAAQLSGATERRIPSLPEKRLIKPEDLFVQLIPRKILYTGVVIVALFVAQIALDIYLLAR